MGRLPRHEHSEHAPTVRSLLPSIYHTPLTSRCRTTGLSDLIGNPTLVQAVNQTNLALKGVLGIGAMGAIAGAAGNAGDATHYNVRPLILHYISPHGELDRNADTVVVE